jgi:hypothetical protein
MVTDQEVVQALNLVRTSPSFVLRELKDRRIEVLQIATVPNDGSIYWVAGQTTIPVGTSIASVFVIENGGGNLVNVYWLINGAWYSSSDGEAVKALERNRDEIFPFDWRYDVPVENDVYHH